MNRPSFVVGWRWRWRRCRGWLRRSHWYLLLKSSFICVCICNCMFVLLLVSPIYSEWWWWCDESSSVSMNSSFFFKAVFGSLFLSVTQSVPRRLSFGSLQTNSNDQRSKELDSFSVQKLFVCWLFTCCWLVLLFVYFVGCGWPWLQAGRSLLEKIVTCCSPLFERTWIPKTSNIKYLPFSNSILQHNCP